MSDASAPSTSSLVETLPAHEVPDSPFEDQRTFCCRLAINAVRGLYFSFAWDVHRKQALSVSTEWGQVDQWNVSPDETVPKTPKKRQRTLHSIPEERDEDDEKSSPDDEEYKVDVHEEESDEEKADTTEEEEEEDIPAVPRTPSRKRKRAPSTPRRRRTTTVAAPTPHSKAALRARAQRKRMAVRPPPPDRSADISLHLEKLPKDAWLRAMHVLHVASRPEALPCRDEEYGKVLRSVEELVEEGSGGCVCKSH